MNSMPLWCNGHTHTHTHVAVWVDGVDHSVFEIETYWHWATSRSSRSWTDVVCQSHDQVSGQLLLQHANNNIQQCTRRTFNCCHLIKYSMCLKAQLHPTHVDHFMWQPWRNCLIYVSCNLARSPCLPAKRAIIMCYCYFLFI